MPQQSERVVFAPSSRPDICAGAHCSDRYKQTDRFALSLMLYSFDSRGRIVLEYPTGFQFCKDCRIAFTPAGYQRGEVLESMKALYNSKMRTAMDPSKTESRWHFVGKYPQRPPK